MSTKYKAKEVTLGAFLRAHRMGEEISQIDFAKKLKISKQRLSDIEHDRSNISIKLAKTIAKKINLPAEYLVKLVVEKQLKDEGINLKVS